MKRKITIELDFDLHNTTKEEIDNRLNYAINLLYGEGWFTGSTDATIEDWSYTIKE